MLDTFPIAVIAGTVLGFLSGLGIGGGSLLMIWLTTMLHMDAVAARSINLLFFIPSAAIVCVLRVRQGDLKIRPLLPAALAGCISAALFSWISTVVDTQILKKLFGIVLLAVGLRELCYRDRNAR